MVDRVMFLLSECLIGYEGMDCSEGCTFPSYGKDCQSTCNCDLNFCNYRIGCINDACEYHLSV